MTAREIIKDLKTRNDPEEWNSDQCWAAVHESDIRRIQADAFREAAEIAAKIPTFLPSRWSEVQERVSAILKEHADAIERGEQ